ncbi:MAG: hypothetical protein GY906_23225 [bacterium]|nr:hypothetical protein [bacterium]
MTDVSVTTGTRQSRSRRTPGAAARLRPATTTERSIRTQREVSIPDLGAGEARSRLATALGTLQQPLSVGRQVVQEEAIRKIDVRINEAQREAFNTALRDPRKAREAAISGQIPVPAQFADIPAFAHTWRVTSATLGAQEDAREFEEGLQSQNPADPDDFLTQFTKTKLEGNQSPVFEETYAGALRDATANTINNFRRGRQAATAVQNLQQSRAWLRTQMTNDNLGRGMDVLHQIEGRYISSAIGPEGKAAARQQAYLDIVEMYAANPEKGYLLDLITEKDPDKDGLSISDIVGPELIVQKQREALNKLFQVKNVEHGNELFQLRQEFAEVAAGRERGSMDNLLTRLDDIDQRWGPTVQSQTQREQIIDAIGSTLNVEAAIETIVSSGSAEFINDKVWKEENGRIIEQMESANPGLAMKVAAERGVFGEFRSQNERDMMSTDLGRVELSLRRFRGMEEASPGAVQRWFNDDVAARFDIYDILNPLGVPPQEVMEALRKAGSPQNLRNHLRNAGVEVTERDKIQKEILKAADMEANQLADFAPARLDDLTNIYLGTAEAVGVSRDSAIQRLGERLSQQFIPVLQGGREVFTWTNFNPTGLNPATGQPVRVRPRTHGELEVEQEAYNSSPVTGTMREAFGTATGFSMLPGHQEKGYLVSTEIDGFEQSLMFAPGQEIVVPTDELPADPAAEVSLLALPGVTQTVQGNNTVFTMPTDTPPGGLAIEGTNFRMYSVGGQLGVFLSTPPEVPTGDPTSVSDVLTEFEEFTTGRRAQAQEVEAVTGRTGELQRQEEENRRFIEGLTTGSPEFLAGNAIQSQSPDTIEPTADTPGITARIRGWFDRMSGDGISARRIPPEVVAESRKQGITSIEDAADALRRQRVAGRAEGSDTDNPLAPEAQFDTFAKRMLTDSEGIRLQTYRDPPGTKGRSIGRGIQILTPDGKVSDKAKRWFDAAGLGNPRDWLKAGKTLSPNQEQALFDVAYSDVKVSTREQFVKLATREFSRETALERWGELTDHQRSVLIELVYNGGPGLLGPNITAAIMNRDDAAVVREIRTNSGSQRNAALQPRRDREAAAWLSYKTRSNP